MSSPAPSSEPGHPAPARAAVATFLSWSVGSALRESNRVSSREMIECVPPSGSDAARARGFAEAIAAKRVAQAKLSGAVETVADVLEAAQSRVLLAVVLLAVASAFLSLPTATSPVSFLGMVAFGPVCLLMTIVTVIAVRWSRLRTRRRAQGFSALRWVVEFITRRLIGGEAMNPNTPVEHRQALVNAAIEFVRHPVEGRRTLLRLSSLGWVVFLIAFVGVHSVHAISTANWYRWESTLLAPETFDPVVDASSALLTFVGAQPLPEGYIRSLEWNGLEARYVNLDPASKAKRDAGRRPAFLLGLLLVMLFGVVPRAMVFLAFGRATGSLVIPSSEDLRELDMAIGIRDGETVGQRVPILKPGAATAIEARAPSTGNLLVVPFGMTLKIEPIPAAALSSRQRLLDLRDPIDGEHGVDALAAALERTGAPAAACVLVAMEQRTDVALKRCIELVMSRAGGRAAVIVTHVLRSSYAVGAVQLEHRLRDISAHLALVPAPRLLLLDTDLACPATLPGAIPQLLEPIAAGTGEPCAARIESPCFVRAMELLREVGSSRVDLQACKLEYSIVSPK